MVAALNLEDKAFIVYIASISQDTDVHPFWRAQIGLLKADETPTSIPPEYVDFTNIFSKDLVVKLPKHIGMNDHAINLIERQ